MKRIQLPLTEEICSSLKAGEYVLLSGEILTARDAAHRRLQEIMEAGKELPIDLRQAAMYYVGPTPPKPGQVIGSAGPTTASRMDTYVPLFMEHGMLGMIGKGRRSQAVKEAIQKYQGVYFVTVGGAGALLSHCIRKYEVIAFEDLLSEAVSRLTVEDFPCFVGIDCQGNDIYDLAEEDEKTEDKKDELI